MGYHHMQHSITSTEDHKGGTPAGVGEYNVLGTSDAGNLVEVKVEAPNIVTFLLNNIVVRSTAGHIFVPATPTNNQHAASKVYVDTVLTSGPWKPVVHSAVPVHNVSTVGNGTTGGNALVPGSRVINLTDSKVYTVTAGTGNGSTVTWDAGVLYNTVAIAPVDFPDAQWQFDPQTNTWTNQGATNHSRMHSIISVTDHSANPWKMFFSNASGNIAEVALGGQYTMLQSGGAAQNPSFTLIGMFPSIVNCAGADPVTTDVATLPNDCYFFAKTSTGRYAFGLKTSK